MRKIIFVIILILSIKTFSQQNEFGQKIEEGNLEYYMSKSGHNFKPGDLLQIGLPFTNTFVFITQGNVGVNSNLSNILVKIESIKAVKLSNGFIKIYALFKGFGVVPIYIDIESAIQTKEIIIN